MGEQMYKPPNENSPLGPVSFFFVLAAFPASAAETIEISTGAQSSPRQTIRPSRSALTGWKLMSRTGMSTMLMSCCSGANPMLALV